MGLKHRRSLLRIRACFLFFLNVAVVDVIVVVISENFRSLAQQMAEL